ncbi:choice-of-anchor U domain-containing protein [Vibrio sp. 1069]|uniref:choice-of-anchor U domain-containing protein n=1 Tax=Vibrio sp. 1069 TaxID=3074541 RepID=UPI0021D2BF57|nr:choice-of-anchor U domain-containing protein [Vibrio sp. 1069]MDW2333297.1 choice-of-anchor U domain-containing protein [Vibrio sp. 1069]
MKKIYGFFLLFIATFYASTAAAEPSVSVVFVLDESGSVSYSNFNLETQGFQQALNSLSLDGSIEVSVVGFSSSVSTIVDKSVLNASSLSTIDSALANNPKNSGGTNMSSAISTSTSILMGSSAPTKVICLATDGSPNSQYSTTTAAETAKASGITLTPVGIGLYSSGETFLNTIASNPPIPNPDDFEEFATVVTNVCVGVTTSALNIDISPDTVNFGVSSGADTCSFEETVTVQNLSTQSAKITSISIEGEDATSFSISSAFGQDFQSLSFPITLSGQYVDSIDIQLNPTSVPDDDNYDASVVITAEDSDGASGSFSAFLSAPSGDECLTTSVIDGGSVIGYIDSAGATYDMEMDSVVTESDISSVIQSGAAQRTGLVADGNARLLISANTSVTNGTMRFELDSSANTESVLGTLDHTTNDAGSTFVDVTLENGQATAVLRAGERFLGLSGEKSVSYNVNICLLDDSNNCTSVSTSEVIQERRAPVVLIHGLWADNGSWVNKNIFSEDTGMKPELEAANFRVEMFEYTNNQGPSITMQSNEFGLFYKIYQQCRSQNEEGFACTRNDIIGHSMGGLVARKYIKDNQYHQHRSNYKQGSVRRLVTLGTPHYGSGFANLLTKQDSQISNCIEDEDAVDNLVGILGAVGNAYGPALNDLSISSTFLTNLNATTQEVSTFGVIGDTGTNLASFDYATTRTGCEHSELFSNNNSDSVVSVASAQGNMNVDNTSTIDGAPHVGMGTNSDIIERAIELLSGPLNEFSPSAKVTHESVDDVLTANIGGTTNTPHKKEMSFGAKFGSILLSLIGINTAYADEMPSVDLTVSSNEVSPSDRITFTATVTGSDVNTIILTDGGQYSENDDSAPYQWEIDVAAEASGTSTFKVVAIIDDQVVESALQTVTVKPDLTSLQSITFEPGNTLYLFPGSDYQLSVVGLFSDGLKRNLTQSAMDTVYSENIVDGVNITEGDSPVIEVSVDGLVKATGIGSAEVKASNNGVTAVQRVSVIAFAADDADGDGLTDAQEEALNTNPLSIDSDGNGVSDKIEVGDVDDPMDSDGDGTIDALESDTRVVEDKNGNHVSIQTSAGTLVSSYSLPLSDVPGRGDDLSTIDMERGLIGFTVEDLNEGDSITVTLTFDSLPAGTDSYLKYGPKLPDSNTLEWYKFSDFEISGNVITLQLTDNELGDSNTLPGVISDPGGPGNDPAIVLVHSNDDNATTNEDTPVTIDVLANDTGEDQPLTVSSYTQPEHGAVSVIGGALMYTPEDNYFGADSFTYVASVGANVSESATVNIDVLSVNDAPQVTVSGPVKGTGRETLTLTAQVSDVDSSNFTYQWVEIGSSLLDLSGAVSGVLNLTLPDVSETTQIQIKVVVNDGAGITEEAMALTLEPASSSDVSNDDSSSGGGVGWLGLLLLPLAIIRRRK